MTPPLCDVCAAPLPGGGHACTRCITGHRQTLAWLRENLGELEAARWRQVRLGRGTGRGGEQTRLPWDDEAATVLTEVCAGLITWARTVTDCQPPAMPGPACVWCEHDTCITARAERRHGRPGPATAMTALDFLAAPKILGWVSRNELAAPLLDEVDDMAKQVRRAIDRHGETVALGPCGNIAPDGFTCAQPLRAHLDATWATCPTCRATYQVAHRRATLLEQLKDRIERPKVIADVLAAYGVTAPYDWIRKRASRGDLHRANEDHPDDPAEYRIGDVLALALHPPVRRGTGRVISNVEAAPTRAVTVGIIARTARPRPSLCTALQNCLTSCHTDLVLDRSVSRSKNAGGPVSCRPGRSHARRPSGVVDRRAPQISGLRSRASGRAGVPGGRAPQQMCSLAAAKTFSASASLTPSNRSLTAFSSCASSSPAAT